MKAKILGVLTGALIFIAGFAGSMWFQSFDNAALGLVGFAVAFVGGFFAPITAFVVREHIEDKEYSNGR